MEKNTRQLAAVMFTDMVGYTALMQRDEQKAKSNRERHRQILEKAIQDSHGVLLQYYGDGTLSVFDSAVEAIKCAVEIQSELQKEPKIPLRIGLHVGDIIYSDDGAFGDAVNIASRIENKSIAGGVLISDKVFDEVKNHPEFRATSLGKFELKNVRHPVELYAVMNEGLVVPSRKMVESHTKDSSKSVAVLPFLNMSADPENEYFSEGITEEIINALTKIDGLNVTARTSCFAFKNKEIDIRDVGEMLGVSFILEGSVRRAGEKVRITAQLINSNDGFHVFSQVYDRDLKDIFAVQDEISLKIANRLRENLKVPLDHEIRENTPTENIEAYDIYLKGRYCLYKGSMEGTNESIIYFEKAIALAPDFALPYTGLSMAYSHISAFRTKDPKESYSVAKKYALKAMKLDDSLVESFLALAHVCFVNEWDFKKTRQLINQAMLLNPGNAEVHGWSSMIANVEPDLEKGLIEAQIAKSLDPLSPMTSYVLGVAFLTNERYNEAIEQFDNTLAKLPFYQQASILKARCFIGIGEFDKAIEIFNNFQIGPDRANVHWGAIGYVYSKMGDMKKVQDCLEKIQEQEKAGTDEFLNWSYTIIYLALNEIDLMFAYLEKSLEEKVASLLFIKVDPLFKQFREDPRYLNLIAKL
jgi:adenylate cyclase